MFKCLLCIKYSRTSVLKHPLFEEEIQVKFNLVVEQKFRSRTALEYLGQIDQIKKKKKKLLVLRCKMHVHEIQWLKH